MFFTLFWMTYEAWQDGEDPALRDLMLALLDVVETAPKSPDLPN